MLAVVMGTVHPVSYGWLFEKPVQIQFPDGKWMLTFRHSQFHIFSEGQEPNDLATFINEVGSIVQGCLDSLGFHLVTPLGAEIMSMIADGNRLIHRTVDWSELLPEPSTRHVAEDKLQPFIAAAMDEPLARLAPVPKVASGRSSAVR